MHKLTKLQNIADRIPKWRDDGIVEAEVIVVIPCSSLQVGHTDHPATSCFRQVEITFTLPSCAMIQYRLWESELLAGTETK
jgi:hypothetical protein